jgi:Type II CAAX prenyl endopeptidase Rce1-like
MTWAKFAVFYAGALLGAVAVAPYSLRLIEQSGRMISASRFLLLSLAQNAVVFCVVIVLGLLAARAVGLGAPYVNAVLGGPAPDHSLGEMLGWSLGLGGAGGALLLMIDLVLIPHFPALLALARKTSLWENFAASFYGGLNEEFLFRLLGLSAMAWLLSRVWHTPSARPTDAVLWSANVIMAVVFGLGHLPAALAITGRITPLLVGRTLALNSPIALMCGWLFWQFGIEAAVAAHFTADVVYHVGGTLLLRANDQFGLFPWFPSAGR